MPEDKVRIDRRLFVFGAAVLPLAASQVLTASPAAASQAAERFVSSVANKALRAARSKSASQFRSLVNRYTAISSVSRFSLGKYARKISPTQKRTYQKLMRSFITRQFIDNAASLAGQSFVVHSSRARSNRDIIVKGAIVFPGGRQDPVEWRVIRSGSSYKVFDIKVKGVWLALNMRSQFSSVLNKNKGDMNALFDYLRKWS